MSQPGQDEHGELRARLRALRVDDPDAAFRASLRRRLVEVGAPEPPPGWRRFLPALDLRRPMPWPALALAVLVLVLASVAMLRASAPRDGASLTTLPVTRVAVVRLNLTAELPVENARITVTLPPGLAFWADGRELAQRSFEWDQALRSGDNDIPIAVRGQAPGRYRIAVRARVGTELVEDEIVLQVVKG